MEAEPATPDRSVTFSNEVQVREFRERKRKRQGRSAENPRRRTAKPTKDDSNLADSSSLQKTAASSNLQASGTLNGTTAGRYMTFGDLQSSSCQDAGSRSWAEVQEQSKSPAVPLMTASQIAREYEYRRGNGSPLRSSNQEHTNVNITVDTASSRALRSKATPSELVDKERLERSELQEIDRRQAEAGPPESRETSTQELGRRSYANAKSSGYSRKNPSERMREELARLLLD